MNSDIRIYRSTIIHVIGNLDRHIGGPRESLIALIKEVGESKEIRHLVLCQFDNDAEQKQLEHDLGFSVFGVRSGGLKPLLRYWSVLVKVRKQNPTLHIHVHGVFKFYPLMTTVFARIHGIRCVLSPRGMTMRLSTLNIRTLVKRMVVMCLDMLNAKYGVVHTTSEYEFEVCRSQFSRSMLIKKSSANFHFTVDQVEKYLPRKRLFITYIGRISTSKGVDVLIRSWLKIDKKVRRLFTLVLVGPLEAGFVFSEQQLMELESEGISYKGPIYDKGKKIKVLNKSRYFINPSASENFGHSIFEALSLGVPVIVSKQSPWGEVEKKGAGMVFDPENVEFSALLVACIETSDSALRRSADAAKIFIERYILTHKNDYSELYKLESM